MFGQGRPNQKRWCAWVLACALMMLCCAPTSTADEGTVKLRVAWGGGESRAWQGTIRLSEGRVIAYTPLGLEADTPGSIWLTDEGELRILTRSPHNYDGVDLTLDCPTSARLLVEMRSPSGKALPTLELPVSQVAATLQQLPLDEAGNRVVAQRQPGDLLPVKFERDSLVFATGEKFEFAVAPRSIDLQPNTTYTLSVTLAEGRTTTAISSQEHEFKTDAGAVATGEVPLSISLPPEEGVYDVRLALYPKRLTSPLVRGKPVAERRIQLVVLDPIQTINRTPATWQTLLEFDPAQPRWWEKMVRLPSWTKIPGMTQQTYGSEKPRTRQQAGRTMVELSPGAWQAYPLSLSNIGMPHVLEIEYPSDLRQTLQVSLIEPNAAGQVVPIGLDTGIDVPEPLLDKEGELRVHRVTFWPQTRAPLVLVVNRRDDGPAALGKIRLLSGPPELPAMALPPPTGTPRLLAAYYDKPLFCENFSAPEAVDEVTGQSRKDWGTFYLGGKRLVEYLQHTGRNAAVITIASDGSTLYPSGMLEPTPQHDSGVYFESGQDPLRKDVVEMLMRLCDRAGIQFIPSVKFTTPLPELEALRNAPGAETIGLEPIGGDGRTWLARGGAKRGQGVYYNALDPRVQDAMRHIVEEIAQRYGHHPSFGGIAVQLSPEGFALLPDESSSLDDATIARFAEQTGTTVPGQGEDRFAARYQFLHGSAARRPWLDWRAEQMAALYRGMEGDIARTHAGAKLYLNPHELFSSRWVQIALRPSLPPQSDPVDILLRTGLDPQRFLGQQNIVLSRPQRIGPQLSVAQALQTQWNRLPELDAAFANPDGGATMIFHEPLPLKLPSFDAVSPFGPEKTKTWLVPQFSSVAGASRQALIHSLAALDSRTIFDGGWMQTLGQEADLEPVVQVYRRLPAEPFRNVEPKAAESRTQPVLLRTLVVGGRTFFYAVNDSPWPLTLDVEMESASLFKLESLSPDRPGALARQGTRAVWTVSMQPYDLVGGELNCARVKIDGWRVILAPELEADLKERIRDARLRANALREPQPRELLLNPSFEMPVRDGHISGWSRPRAAGITVEVDVSQGHTGRQSLHLVSRPEPGKQPSVVWIRSEPFDVPRTGRLSLLAWIRVDDPAQQPKLRLAIEGRMDGKSFYRRANVGASEDGQPVRALQKGWAPYRFPLNDLPLIGLTDLRVGFDLMGPGEVWIDDVQVFDSWLEDNERDELLKNIATADFQLGAGQMADCERFMGGYWTQFLRENVPLEEQRLATGPVAGPTADSSSLPSPSANPAPSGSIYAPVESAPAGRRGNPLKRNGSLKEEREKKDKTPSEEKPGMFERMKGWLPKSPLR